MKDRLSKYIGSWKDSTLPLEGCGIIVSYLLLQFILQTTCVKGPCGRFKWELFLKT